MKKPNIIILNEKNGHSITSDTLWKILSLLDATRTLINNIDEDVDENEYLSITTSTGDPTVAAGLYTFAVEEYGKYLYLKSLEPIDEKYHVDYWKEFRNHPKKFQRALSNLPKECRLVEKGGFTDTGFTDSGFNTEVIANFETRLRIFYSDFDSYFANKIPTQEPPVSAKLLKIGVQKLWEIVNSEHTKLMNEKNKK